MCVCVLDWWCAVMYRYLPLLLDGGVGAVDIFVDTHCGATVYREYGVSLVVTGD